MTTDELRDTSPHNPPSDVFGKARRSLKAVPVKPYAPKRLPVSVRCIAGLGMLCIALGIINLVMAPLLWNTGGAMGFYAITTLIAGLSGLIAGIWHFAVYHIAKAVIENRDINAYKSSGV